MSRSEATSPRSEDISEIGAADSAPRTGRGQPRSPGMPGWPGCDENLLHVTAPAPDVTLASGCQINRWHSPRSRFDQIRHPSIKHRARCQRHPLIGKRARAASHVRESRRAPTAERRDPDGAGLSALDCESMTSSGTRPRDIERGRGRSASPSALRHAPLSACPLTLAEASVEILEARTGERNDAALADARGWARRGGRGRQQGRQQMPITSPKPGERRRPGQRRRPADRSRRAQTGPDTSEAHRACAGSPIWLG